MSLTFLICTANAFCADIEFQKDPDGFGIDSAIVIDGEITEGDYEKFLEAVLHAGPHPGRVFLSSPGGSVSEAIKIGSLIRALGFHTQVPAYVGPYPVHCGRYNVSECTCGSACILVFAGGVVRNGDYINVHRAFIDHKALRGMSASEAAAYSNAIASRVGEYLQQMGAPTSLMQIMQSIPSNESKLLNREFVNDHFWGPAPNVEEWIIARCGNSESILKKMTRDIARDDYEELSDEYGTVARCQRRAFSQEREKVFSRAIITELANANDDFLPQELKDLKDSAPGFDFLRLLGARASEIGGELRLLGFGSDVAEAITNMEGDSASWEIGDNVEIEVNKDKVTEVRLYFFENSPYQGLFVRGLSSESTPLDFEKLFGRPESVNPYLFRQNRVTVHVGFDNQEGSLSILFLRHDLWNRN